MDARNPQAGDQFEAVWNAWLALQTNSAVTDVPRPAHPPRRCRCLVLAPAGEEVPRILKLLQAVEAVKGSLELVVSPSDWPRMQASLNTLVEQIRWLPEQRKAYEPPWFVDRSKVEHLMIPLCVQEAVLAEGSRLLVYVSDPSASSLSHAVIGSFHRVWDCGVLESANLEDFTPQFLSLLQPGGSAIIQCSGAEKAARRDVGVAAHRSASSASLEDRLRNLVGITCDLHVICAGDVQQEEDRPAASTGKRKASSEGQRLCLVLTKRDRSGLVAFRPPPCVCCR